VLCYFTDRHQYIGFLFSGDIKMKLIKNHPLVLKLGGNLTIGKTYHLSGIGYEVVDNDFSTYELQLTNFGRHQ
jgi:hypothetical protein